MYSVSSGNPQAYVRRYELYITVADGQSIKKFLVLTRRATGIYLATFYKQMGQLHTSYHEDGTSHFRAPGAPGPDPPDMKKLPLAKVRGSTQMCYAVFPITLDQFDQLPPLTPDDYPDCQLSLNLADLNDQLDLSIWIMEVDFSGPKPLQLRKELILEKQITETTPWLFLHLYAP